MFTLKSLNYMMICFQQRSFRAFPPKNLLAKYQVIQYSCRDDALPQAKQCTSVCIK